MCAFPFNRGRQIYVAVNSPILLRDFVRGQERLGILKLDVIVHVLLKLKVAEGSLGFVLLPLAALFASAVFGGVTVPLLGRVVGGLEAALGGLEPEALALLQVDLQMLLVLRLG